MPDDGAPGASGSGRVTVVGVSDDRYECLSPEARQALAEATLVVGGRRHLAHWSAWRAESAATAAEPDHREIAGDLDDLVAAVRRRALAPNERVCVLASGDPGFFGIVRALTGALDRRTLRVLPAPSAVALAFARLGLPWDDAVVVSAHGRALAEALGVLRGAAKAAVLTSPDSPPEALGRALLDGGARPDLVAVCSRLGSPDEAVVELDLADLAAGSFDPLSVVVVVGPGGLALSGWRTGATDPAAPAGPAGRGATLAWGLPETAFAHRAGMITKAEVRSVVLGKLALPASGVLWDLGAASASVAIECALLRPGLSVLAVEREPADAASAAANAARLGAAVHVVTGRAPAALAGLPDPDRVFVGGGGLDVLDAAVARLRPGGRMVATFAAMDRAAAAAERLGHLAQVSVDRGARLPDGGWRLAARNPVFVVWGPDTESGGAG